MTTAKKSPFQETYLRAAGAVAFVAIADGNGDEGIGSAFHIGDGIFITARHVVESATIREVATTKSVHLSEEAGGRMYTPRRLKIVDGPHFGPEGLDVAVFRADLGDTPLPSITVSQHTDYSIEENDLVLSDILVIGYPPIPFTTVPNQVVALGQINAVVRVHHSPSIHFIASATARGGFSGGVALDQSGKAIALVTESLGQIETPVETGYMSLLSIASAVDLATEVFGFSTEEGVPGRYSDTLFAARFSNPTARPLSSFIYDASIYVYDDDRDLFVEINCADEALLAAAVKTYDALTPIKRVDVVDGFTLYIPEENPPARLLLQAGEAVADLFVRSGYRLMDAERSRWQLRGT
ncbi:MAG TPA: serine protease [Allosphingosinicella sp.]|jgi:hypothetical protein